MAALNIHLLFVLILLIKVSVINGGNVLIQPYIGEGSHYHVAMNIATELIRRGHNVTMLLDDRFEDNAKPPFQDGQPNALKFEFFKANFTMAETYDLFRDMTNAGLEGRFREWMINILKSDHTEKLVSECRNLLNDKELIASLEKANFDLTIKDSANLCPVAQSLRKPYVVLSAVLTMDGRTLLQNRGPFNPSYIPAMTTANDHKMTFVDRLSNTVNAIFFAAVMSLLANPFEEFNAYNGASSDFTDTELWLLNTHFVLDFPRPLLPNTVTVGGLTTREAKPLSHDWEEFLQGAGKDGVVLFSMGSYAREINDDIAAMFAGAFAQLPQKVIWKLNGNPSANLTPNVKVVDWIPQNDLLGHPQIKAFVYHCGMNGVWEAVYHGVPMVAVPLFGDQMDNAQRIVSRGMGVKVDIATLTSDELAKAIRRVIDNPSYKSNATRMSAIFRDTPRKPIELAVDWLEYVIRHGGAKHLRSAALDLNIFQYLLLDVILVLLVAFITFVSIAICFCRFCFKTCRKLSGSSSKVKSE